VGEKKKLEKRVSQREIPLLPSVKGVGKGNLEKKGFKKKASGIREKQNSDHRWPVAQELHRA